jgi:hypothetical protein
MRFDLPSKKLAIVIISATPPRTFDCLRLSPFCVHVGTEETRIPNVSGKTGHLWGTGGRESFVLDNSIVYPSTVYPSTV